MIFESKNLLKELKEQTEKHISINKKFLELSEEQLNFRKNENSWNILECIQHLVNYSEYYYALINYSIENSKTQPKETFSTGILGNYFVKSMLSKSRMKSPEDKNPFGESLSKDNILYFLEQQEFLLHILEKAENVDLEKIKIPISIAKFIKLKLGDTLRFIIYHNERHILQAQNISK